MCEHCDPTPPEAPRDAPPDSPQPQPSHGRVTRRVFIGLGAAAVAGAIVRCAQRSGSPIGPRMPATGPATRPDTQPSTAPARQPATAPASQPATASTTAPATQAATQAATQPLVPAPDLGDALFPDALGQPIATAADCPVIIEPRRRWTTQPPHYNQIVLMNGISRITIHHTAGPEWEEDRWRPTASKIENIRVFHTGAPPTDRGWADIAYHFVVDRAGRVWQARPLVYQGAHVKHHNEHNIGIVLLGNFNLQHPSAAQTTNLATFVTFLRRLYGVAPDQVFMHRELGHTDCPGDQLVPIVDRMRVKWRTQEQNS